jgi:hypothetical protein
MKKNSILYSLFLVAVLCVTASCGKIDDYKDIAGDSEHSYPGKIENIFVFPGDGRVVVTGDFISDPKVVTCRIYWDLKADSVDVPVDMSGGPQVLYKEILLPEKVYNFDIYTYDAQGNYSIPVHGSGRSYGNNYRATISNRLVKSTAFSFGAAIIEWYPLDQTQGPISTMLTYTTTVNDEVTVPVPLDEQTTTLYDYKLGTAISYVTSYRPSGDCLDIFETPTGQVTIN